MHIEKADYVMYLDLASVPRLANPVYLYFMKVKMSLVRII